MDYQKKKQLTQSAAFLQTHLNLSNEFLEQLIVIGVLSREEVITIQKDQTTSGKVLELVCTLKRKDTRTYNRFIEALEENDCYTVAQVLQNTEPGEVVKADRRTMHVLENHLPDVPLRTLEDIAAYLLPCEIYHDEINSLQDKITNLQQALADSVKPGGLGGRQSSQGSSDGSSTGRSGVGTPAASSAAWDVPQWDVPSQAEELRQVLRQKDEIIQRKDAEYAKLRKILSDTQNDMQGVLDLNSQYVTIIGQLNSMASMPAGVKMKSGEKHDDYMELEGQVEQAQLRIDELTAECTNIQTKMDSKQLELEKALRREKKYKEMLGLDLEADEIDVMEKIQKLMEDGKMQKTEVQVDKIRKELSKVKNSRITLEERVTTLGREKEKIEFHMRQQELTIKKMNRQRTANEVIQKSQFMMNLAGNDPRTSTQLKLPSIERPPSSISLSSKVSKNTTQFCMFCRAEFTPLKSQTCRAHFRPIRGGKWTCCRDDCHRSAGCLQLPHFYIEITVDKKIFLTDGARYMELSC